jgi:hypothetical protein
MPEKPDVVYYWFGRGTPTPTTSFGTHNIRSEHEGHDWKWQNGRFKYHGIGTYGKGPYWIVLQFGEPEKVTRPCPGCGTVVPGSAAFCPNCGQRVQKTARASSDEYLTKDGREITFKTFEDDPRDRGPSDKGFVVHTVEAYIEGKQVGYLKISYIPKERFLKKFPTIWHWLARVGGRWGLLEPAEKRDLNELWSKAKWLLWGREYKPEDAPPPRQRSEELLQMAQPYLEKFESYKKYHIDKPMVDFICTEPAERRSGVGAALLRFGARWMAYMGLPFYGSNLRTQDGGEPLFQGLQRKQNIRFQEEKVWNEPQTTRHRISPTASKLASRWLRAAVASPALKLLQVFAKGQGKTGTYDIDLLREALALIGWSVTESTAARQLGNDDIIARVLKDWLKEHNAETWGYAGVKEPVHFWFRSEAEAAIGRREFPLKEGSPPDSPPVGLLYVGQIGSPFISSYTNRPSIKTQGWWMGVPSFQVHTPQGESPSFPMRVDDRGRIEDLHKMQPAAFLTWAYKNGLKELAQKHLDQMGEEAVSDLTRPITDRTLDNTGTCPACFSNVKLVRGHIMRHGWTVQGERARGGYGYSWHSGPCFGVSYQPFEVSSKGTQEYLSQVILPHLDWIVKTQGQLERGEITEIPNSRRPGSPLIKPDGSDTLAMRNWRDYYVLYTRQIEQEHRALIQMKSELETHIQKWKPMPLPGDRVRGRQARMGGFFTCSPRNH